MEDFAAAGVADEGEHLAGVGFEGDIVQDGALGVVAEGDVLEGNAADDAGQGIGVGLVGDVRPGVEQIEDALGAGHGGHELGGVEVPEVDDRVHEPVPIEEGGDDGADACDPRRGDQVAAIEQDDGLSDEADQVQERLVDAVDAGDVDVVVGVGALERIKHAEIGDLAVEGHDHPHAGNVLGQVGRDAASSLPGRSGSSCWLWCDSSG